MKIVFLGPPGAGKGTQAATVTKKYSLAHISSGDLLRAEIKSKSELGLKVKDIIEAGELVPDELIIEMMRKRIAQADCKNGFLLDGFPRTVSQADALEDITQIDVVVNIDVPLTKLAERISRRLVCKDCGATYNKNDMPDVDHTKCLECSGEMYQRDDDRYETVMKRLDVYEKNTAPLVAYYKNNGKLVTVDGDQAIKQVGKQILETLERFS